MLCLYKFICMLQISILLITQKLYEKKTMTQNYNDSSNEKINEKNTLSYKRNRYEMTT